MPDVPNPVPPRRAEALLTQLRELRDTVEAEAQRLVEAWQVDAASLNGGALNMARYVALRRYDLRQLQRDLTPFGLSSLGRLEGHVRQSLDAVIGTLEAVVGTTRTEPPALGPGQFFAGEELLRTRALDLFGPPPVGAEVAIMVTIDPLRHSTGAAVAQLVHAGASVFRINCAHDDADAWRAMVESIREAERECGRRCAILMDLSGPKVRTATVTTPKGVKRVFTGDQLELVEEADAANRVRVNIPQLTTTVPGICELLKPGNRVLLDDGKLDAVVECARPESALLRVTQTQPRGLRLRADKGINVPGVVLPVESLSEKDLRDLDFAVECADMIGLSYVKSAADVERLQQEIAQRAGPRQAPGIVAKIETPAAFRALPPMIATGLRLPFAVMIARGDLAVEAGFERMAEVQEEMLWLCESAHVPVIWATQVLESLSKEATYSRAEVTDAAVASRAECVMLNKGDHLPEAVSALANLLGRMTGHQRKKSPQLRALQAW